MRTHSITPAYKVVSVLLSALASKSKSLGLAVPGVRLPRPSWQGFEQCFCLGVYLALLGTGMQVMQARGHPVQLVKASILGCWFEGYFGVVAHTNAVMFTAPRTTAIFTTQVPGVAQLADAVDISQCLVAQGEAWLHARMGIVFKRALATFPANQCRKIWRRVSTIGFSQ